MKKISTLFWTLLLCCFSATSSLSAQCTAGTSQDILTAFADFLINNELEQNEVRTYCVNTNFGGGVGGTITFSSNVPTYPYTATVTDAGTMTVQPLNNFNDVATIAPNTTYELVLTAGPNVGSAVTSLVLTTPITQVIPPVTVTVVEALPVTWSRALTADPQDKKVMLDWAVTNQVDVAGYELQRKLGGNWTTVSDIGVKAGGSELFYSASDVRQTQETAYRIRQHDFDGSESFSNVVIVPGAKLEGLSVFPNPVNDVLRFTAEATLSSVKLVTMTGQTVRESNASGNKNTFQVADLPRGMYILRAKAENGKAYSRRVLLR